jgi:hypothetical protein
VKLVRLTSDLLATRGRGLKNLFARRSVIPLVVIESDDWGSERMRSRASRDALIRAGALPATSDYHADAMESAEDLEAMADVLRRVRGSDGRSVVMTPFVNPANPDFDAIAANNFMEYVPEPLARSHARRGDGDCALRLWRQLMDDGLMMPEYHAREHLQVSMWMEWLRTDRMVRLAFEHGVYSVQGQGLPAMARQFRAACFFRSPEEIPSVGEMIVSGAQMFEEAFERTAVCFCPPNNVFHPDLIPWLHRAGIRGLVRGLRGPEPDARGGGRVVWRLRSTRDQAMTTWSRNAVFEPQAGIGVNHCLQQVASAMRWRVPAVITTHRTNYVGSISPENREQGLRALTELLQQIVKRWPAVRFISSRDLLANVAIERQTERKLRFGSDQSPA